MALQEISVEELTFGMYVSKLDRSWTETPFVYQGFVLKSERQIEALKKHCRTVFIDTEKEERIDLRQASAEDIAKVRGSTVYKEAASVEAELPRAQSAFSQTAVVVEELSRAVEAGNVIDGVGSREAASNITKSVVRNPDAMALLIKLQEKSGATLSRAAEISVLMTIFGRFLQLPQDRLEILGMLGLLQDVGKLKLPTQLAVNGPANPSEIELFRTHVAHSVEILRNTPGLPAELSGLAALHHENFDGSGYPRGMRGAGIALFGLIAGIVDTFDALTAPPPFGENLSPSNAINILYKGRGQQFHPALVEQFIQCIGVFPVGSAVELNSGEIAVVISHNMARRLQPRIMVVRDPTGNAYRPFKMLDLIKEPKIKSGEPYRILRTLEYGAVKIDPRELFL